MNPRQEPVKDFKFPSIVNGVDYLRSVVDLLTRQEQESRPRDLKYVVLHLQAAVEVLLKHRLMMKDWELVLTKSGKTFEDFKKGAFKSVGIDKTIERLEEHCEITVDPETKDLLTDLGKKRNALQHWGHTDELVPLQTLSIDVLEFLMDFLYREILEELREDEREAIGKDIEEVQSGLAEVIGFMNARMLRIQPELDQARKDRKLVVECPSCRRATLVSYDTENKCLLCPKEWDASDLVTSYMEEILNTSDHSIIKDGDSDPRKHCPECQLETLLLWALKSDTGEGMHACFNCGLTFTLRELAECTDCLEMFYDYEGAGVACNECMGNRVNYD